MAAAPSWSTVGNSLSTPTGEFLGSTNPTPLVFKTAGNEAARVDAQGHVGIGTTNPSFDLHLATGKVFRLEGATATAPTVTCFSFGGNGAFSIDAPGQPGGRFMVDNSGHVTAGTNAPQGLLTLAGPDPAQGTLTFFDTAKSADVKYDGGNDQLFVVRATNNAKTALLGGDIGIGTAAPTGLLTLTGPDPLQGSFTFFDDARTADISYDGGSDQLFLIHATNNAKTGVTGGDIGIGTTAPDGLLTLTGPDPRQGTLTFFDDAKTADVKYDGGNDQLFVVRAENNAKTALLGGDIGIGTTAPTGVLTITGPIPAQGSVTYFDDAQTADISYDGGSDQLFLIRAINSAITAFLGGRVGIGTSTPASLLHVEGDLTVAGRIFLGCGDCAEQFDVQGSLPEPGTVVVIGEEGSLHESRAAYDRKVAGVVSGAGSYKPGLILDKQPSEEARATVALVGKVFCKVDAQFAPIEVGDLLTTSPTPGHAMKAADSGKAFGSIIGKALKRLQTGQGLIPILVALQ